MESWTDSQSLYLSTLLNEKTMFTIPNYTNKITFPSDARSQRLLKQLLDDVPIAVENPPENIGSFFMKCAVDDLINRSWPIQAVYTDIDQLSYSLRYEHIPLECWPLINLFLGINDNE